MELQKIYTEGKGLLSAFAESRIGGRSENQDSYGWQDTDFGYLLTVCDGMGGGPGGKTASTIAVKEIIAGVVEAEKDEEIPNIIIKAIRRANMAIIEAGNENPKLKGMGSTATVLLVSEKSAFVAHVGDSRIYQFRGHKKIFRTFDHSMVFDMVSQGVITEEQARLSAVSNVITRALGIKPDVEVDIKEVAFEKGDRFMLCSDGIHGTMEESVLVKMSTDKSRKLGVVTDDIATYVDNLGRTHGGGHDNLTLALVEMNINSILKEKMAKQTKITILGLVALVIISMALNIVQCSGTANKGIPMAADSTKLYKDSLNNKSDSIRQLHKAIGAIDSHLQEISRGKWNDHLDSIERIVKNNK